MHSIRRRGWYPPRMARPVLHVCPNCGEQMNTRLALYHRKWCARPASLLLELAVEVTTVTLDVPMVGLVISHTSRVRQRVRRRRPHPAPDYRQLALAL